MMAPSPEQGESPAKDSSAHPPSSAAVVAESCSSTTPFITSTTLSSSVPTSKYRPRSSLPFSLFPSLFFLPDATSSLVPSTAQGKPIPLADTTAALYNRTSAALQKLNSTYPSASASPSTSTAAAAAAATEDSRSRSHRSSTSSSSSSSHGAKSITTTTGTQSGSNANKYSQPVIVKTYSGPSSSSNTTGTNRNNSILSSRNRIPLSELTPTTISTGTTSHGSGFGSSELSNMPSRQSSKPPPPPRSRGHGHSASTSSLASKLPFISSWASFSSTQKQQEQQPEIRLPPLEAFTFESFMSSQNDVSADLDRIAEICARSRYSLSNQYEVHVAPHGSGSSFVSSATTRNNRRAGGLHSRAQSVGGSGAEDDSSATGSRSQQHRGRRSGAGTRKKSVAYGTLETIMSSSRSSEEGDSKSEGNGKHKKSAGEVVDAVRGRAGKRNCGGGGGDLEEAESVSRSGSGGRKSSATSFANAIMESRSTTAVDASLHGKGKKKKENDGESEAAAAAVAAAGTGSSNKGRRRRDRNRSGSLVSEPALPRMTGSHLGVMTGIAHSGIVDAEVRIFDDEQQHGFGSEYAVGGGDFDGEWNTWVPWRAGDGAVHEDGIPALNAEGRLRQLLRNTGDGFGR